MKKYVPLAESKAPHAPREFDTTVSVPSGKDFPMQRGDMLIVRNAKGRVTRRVDVGEYVYTHPLTQRREYGATLTIFDR